jgi:alpha-L-rhamnosidase
MSKSFTGFIEARFNGLNVGDSVFITISDNPYGIDNFHQNHLYIARGEKGETFRNRFNYFSGRYIYFSGLKQTPELSDFRGYAITSAPERTAQFECSSDLFNKIYETDLHTFEMCTTEGYTADCSNRERIGYGGEGYYLSSYGLGLPCFESGAFYVKRQRDFLDVQNQDGKMPNAAPQINGGGGILWGSGFLNLGLDQYLAYGDKKELEKIYPAGKRWLDFLNNSVTDGLVGEYPGNAGFFGDWVGVNYRIERSKTARAHFFNNCAYAMSLDFLIQIAEIIGKGEDVDVYRERLKTLREKIHERYYDPALESYLNGDQVRTAFALYAGVVPEELRPAVLKHLENDLTAAHPYFDIGDSSRYPYFKILFTYPQFQNIIAGILSKTTYPGYGYFLSKGETTWPETWEATHSTHIHTSYTGISAWFFKILAGIEPDIENPGYRTITIRPQVVDILTYAKAAIESPYGRIESGWLKEAGRIVYEITVPVNSNANIYLPAEISAIKESGNDLAQAKGINITEEKEGSVVLNVESGKYRFEVLK